MCDRPFTTLWHYGLDVDAKAISPTPNGVAMLKLLCGGEVRFLCADATSIVQALAVHLSKDQVSATEILEKLVDFSLDTLKSLSQHVKFYTGVQKKGDIIFIPVGFITIEIALSGMLLYGIRKSFVLRSKAHHTAYASLMGTYAAAKKDTTKMQLLAQHMEADDDD